MPPDEPTIAFRQSRDVGEVITATFTYLRQNWRTLGKALLFIVGPILAVQLVVSSLFQGQIFEIMQLGGGGPATPEELAQFYESLLVPLLIMLPANLLVIVLSVAVVYEHMRRYHEGGGPGAVTVAGVWSGVKRSFGNVLGTTLAAFFGGGAVVFVVVMVGSVVTGGLTAGVGPVGAGLGVLLMLLGMMCVGGYLLVLFALLFPVRMYEGVGLGTALGRVRRLLRGVFWRSLGVVFVVTLLYYVMATAFSMPASLLGFAWGFGGSGGGTLFQVVFIAANVVGGAGGTAAYTVPLVAAGLYYFGLVEEKEHHGLAERVAQVGSEKRESNEGRESTSARASDEAKAKAKTNESSGAGKQASAEEMEETKEAAEKDEAARWRPPAGGPGDV